MCGSKREEAPGLESKMSERGDVKSREERRGRGGAKERKEEKQREERREKQKSARESGERDACAIAALKLMRDTPSSPSCDRSHGVASSCRRASCHGDACACPCRANASCHAQRPHAPDQSRSRKEAEQRQKYSDSVSSGCSCDCVCACISLCFQPCDTPPSFCALDCIPLPARRIRCAAADGAGCACCVR